MNKINAAKNKRHNILVAPDIFSLKINIVIPTRKNDAKGHCKIFSGRYKQPGYKMNFYPVPVLSLQQK